jgi:hypothetical protein
MFDPIEGPKVSLQEHSLNFKIHYNKGISKQALYKRFNKNSVEFISTLLTEALNHKISKKPLPSEYLEKFTTIRVMDSTEFKLPSHAADQFPGYKGDGTNACAQIQLEYDILNGSIEHISLDHALVSDIYYSKKEIDSLKKGSLILRDLGYYNLSVYKELSNRGIYFISRLKPQVKIYMVKNNQYKELTYKNILQLLRKSGRKYIDLNVYIGKEHKQPVRLIANLLSKDQRKRRLKRYQNRNGKISLENRLLSNLNLFVTNVERSKCDSNEVYELYRLRWQIELIFKCWKSIIKIHEIRKMSTERIKCYILAKLLWIVINWDIYNVLNKHYWKNNNKVLSRYKFYKISFLYYRNIRTIIWDNKHHIKQLLMSLFGMIDYIVKESRNDKIKVEKILRMI